MKELNETINREHYKQKSRDLYKEYLNRKYNGEETIEDKINDIFELRELMKGHLTLGDIYHRAQLYGDEYKEYIDYSKQDVIIKRVGDYNDVIENILNLIDEQLRGYCIFKPLKEHENKIISQFTQMIAYIASVIATYNVNPNCEYSEKDVSLDISYDNILEVIKFIKNIPVRTQSDPYVAAYEGIDAYLSLLNNKLFKGLK